MNNIVDYKLRPPLPKAKPTLQTEARKTIHLLMGTLAAMIFILIIAFFALTNASAQKGYALQQTQLQNQTLKNQQENLSARITEIAAFQKIQTDPKIKTMSAGENVQFITKEDNKI